MLNENFIILGFAIQLLGGFKYLLLTIQGRVKPNKVTYFLWGLAPLIAFAAQMKEGVGLPSLLALGIGLPPAVIFFASFINKKAEWKLGPFDFLCGFLSLLGLFLWFVTQSGNFAIIFAILADALAALPTIVKAYRYPETEYGPSYLAALISAFLTLLAINNWTFAVYGFSAYTLLINLILYPLIQFKLGKRLS